MDEPGAEPPFASWFMERYPRFVRFAAAVCGDGHLAPDLVQEAFIQVEARHLPPAPGLDAYVRRTILNLARSRYRRLRIERDALDGAVEQIEPAFDHDHAQVWTAILRLSPRQRAVIALRFYEDFTDTEIAGVLGVSEGSVRTHLFRAMRRLRVLLGEGGDDDAR